MLKLTNSHLFRSVSVLITLNTGAFAQSSVNSIHADLNSESFLLNTPFDQAPEPTVTLVVKSLKTYCGACHGLGKLNFLPSEDYAENWKTIYTATSPSTGRVWRDAIIDVISWPTEAPPAFDQVKDPLTGRDWMPKGIKRLQMGEATIVPQNSDTPIGIRSYILEELSNFQ